MSESESEGESESVRVGGSGSVRVSERERDSLCNRKIITGGDSNQESSNDKNISLQTPLIYFSMQTKQIIWIYDIQRSKQVAY